MTLCSSAPRRGWNPLRCRANCMTDISEVVVLPTLVNHLRRDAPGVLTETERIWSDSARRLESGEVDVAVGFMPHRRGLLSADLVRAGLLPGRRTTPTRTVEIEQARLPGRRTHHGNHVGH